MIFDGPPHVVHGHGVPDQIGNLRRETILPRKMFRGIRAVYFEWPTAARPSSACRRLVPPAG